MLQPAHPDRLPQKQITPPLTPGALLTCLITIPAQQEHAACTYCLLFGGNTLRTFLQKRGTRLKRGNKAGLALN